MPARNEAAVWSTFPFPLLRKTKYCSVSPTVESAGPIHARLNHKGYESVLPEVTFGHEFSATVVETGSGVSNWKTDDQGSHDCPAGRITMTTTPTARWDCPNSPPAVVYRVCTLTEAWQNMSAWKKNFYSPYPPGSILNSPHSQNPSPLPSTVLETVHPSARMIRLLSADLVSSDCSVPSVPVAGCRSHPFRYRAG